MDELSAIFRDIQDGKPVNSAELLPKVYEELHRIARAMFARESPGHTLQATAVVHEAYLRLLERLEAVEDGKRNSTVKISRDETDADNRLGVDDQCHDHSTLSSSGDRQSDADESVPSSDVFTSTWNSKSHFFAAAAEAMRRVLIDYARQKKRLKRGGDRQRVEFEPADLIVNAAPEDLIALNDALSLLETQDPIKASVVKLRYFTGLSVEETAAILNISTASVKRYWAYSKAWLRREMERDLE